MRAAVLGLGQMGHALASRLLDTGHEVTVWNRSPGRAGDLVSRGAKEAESPPLAVAGAQVVLTSLRADQAVLDVLLPGGTPLPLPNEAVVAECSTVAPATTRRLGAIYADHLVALPVLGGPAALAAGEAGLLLAGPPRAVERLRPLLGSLSGAVRHCGDQPATALVVKLLNNYLLMGGIALLSEAVAGGQRAGLDDDLLVDLLGSSPMVAAGLRNRIEDLVRGDHDGWFPPEMGAKDVGLWQEVAGGPDRPFPLAALVQDRFQQAAGAPDLTAVIELLRA